VERIKDFLMQYKVIFFREQNLDDVQQERFARQFGDPRFDPLETNVEGHPGLSTLDAVPFFHSDWMFQEDPPKWAMLQMTKVPPVGGDTMFVDLVGGYEALSEPMRRFLKGLTVLHAMDPGHASKLEQAFIRRNGADHPDYETVREHLQPGSQPLVRLIPETGRENYWLAPAYSRRLNELAADESDALLRFLFQHQLGPQFVIRWKWTPGDIAFWDHRTTLHSGVKDYGDFERHGRRASIAGGKVVPAPA
jgi:taurine dioxygenase